MHNLKFCLDRTTATSLVQLDPSRPYFTRYLNSREFCEKYSLIMTSASTKRQCHVIGMSLSSF